MGNRGQTTCTYTVCLISRQTQIAPPSAFDTDELNSSRSHHYQPVEIRHLFSCQAGKQARHAIMQVQTISVCLSSPLLMIVARATRSDAVGSLTLVIAYNLTFETSSPVELDHTIIHLCLLEKGDSWTVYSQPATGSKTFPSPQAITIKRCIQPLGSFDMLTLQVLNTCSSRTRTRPPTWIISLHSVPVVTCLIHLPWCHLSAVLIYIPHRLGRVAWGSWLVRGSTIFRPRHRTHCTGRRCGVVANILHWSDAGLSWCIRDLRCIFTVWANTEGSRRSCVDWRSQFARRLRHWWRRHIVVQFSGCRSC